MKHTVKLFALLAAVLCCLTACEKNPESSDKQRDITYTVNPGTQASRLPAAGTAAHPVTVHLETEAEWQALLDRFCDWAEEGSTVTFYRPGTQPSRLHAGGTPAHPTKDATTFSTTDREEMKRWMAQMEDEGMTVTVTFDSNTGTWNGTAYATAPQPPMPSGGLLTYECDAMNLFGYIWSFDTANHRVYITLHENIQHITAPDYPVGVYEYRHADEVNTPFAYWLIDQWGDTAGLYTLNSIGSDTLHYNSTRLGNPATLVRTDRWHTYLYSNWGINIAMHVCGNVIDVYPEVYVGQMGVHGLERIDFIYPFGDGRFEMWRSEMWQPAMGAPIWGLTLDFRPFGGADTLGGFTIQGVPFADNQFTITKENIGQFTFQRL